MVEKEELEFAKPRKFKIAWNDYYQKDLLISLEVDTFDLEILSKILADNSIKGFGVTVIQ